MSIQVSNAFQGWGEFVKKVYARMEILQLKNKFPDCIFNKL